MLTPSGWCAAGEALITPAVTRRLVDRFVAGTRPHGGAATEPDALTVREREVLGLVAGGLSNVEIARALHLGQGTVKTHVARILAKLGLRDRVQVVVFAYERGIIEPGHLLSGPGVGQPGWSPSRASR